MLLLATYRKLVHWVQVIDKGSWQQVNVCMGPCSYGTLFATLRLATCSHAGIPIGIPCILIDYISWFCAFQYLWTELNLQFETIRPSQLKPVLWYSLLLTQKYVCVLKPCNHRVTIYVIARSWNLRSPTSVINRVMLDWHHMLGTRLGCVHDATLSGPTGLTSRFYAPEVWQWLNKLQNYSKMY